MSQFAVGSLIKARGREWIVLPESTEEQILARPLGGTEEEIAGFLPELENIQPAQFQLPSPDQAGDYLSCRLLRDALRLGFRSSAGPFRSFGRISVEPRPYQLVPLLMALKLDPVRLLIADDVGIGKTVETALIIRELIDRGEVTRFAVLCPPQIAEQWQRELFSKFHLDAELVLPSTIHRLERACRLNQSIYERFPYQIISTDFVKSDRRRDDFVRACPELVIVDEAHTCARLGETRGGRHQRHQLLSQLAQNAERHILLVTATPHSGNEEGFRSLLSLLKPEFAHLPQDLSGDKNRKEREKIAAHFVQRRRGDIRNYLRTDTPFPERFEAEENYRLHPEYKRLFEKVLDYARESVNDPTLDRQRQRIRWWSALALLRSMASSPAAAVATLRTRAVEANSIEEIDELGYKSVMDPSDEDSTEANDLVPAGTDDQLVKQNETSQKLMQMAQEAEQLFGTRDNKLIQLIPKLEALLKEGFYPIIFCRFIPTAEYVALQLRKDRRFSNQVQIEAVTGTLPPKEREDRINQFDETKPRILVCTDCLSEGINLQRLFNAVIHYDLSWNPTRHEQREGRVDRYGQPSARVRALTYYGLDNRIDGVVLDVLLRKHRTIRNSLGVSIPVPADSEKVLEAVFQGLLLRGKKRGAERTLWDDIDIPDEVKIEWESATEREKLSRTLFAQQTIRVEEVTQELQASQRAIGSGVDVKEFFKLALSHCGGVLTEENTLRVNMTEVPRSLKERLNLPDRFQAKFELPVAEGVIHLSRSHPAIEGLANYVLNTALDPHLKGPARRCGVIRTAAVTKRTTLLLLRYRFHILSKIGEQTRPLLAEDCELVAFAGSPQNAEWLAPEVAESLLSAQPSGNLSPEQVRDFLNKVLAGMDFLIPKLRELADAKAQALFDAHTRVRQATRVKHVRQTIASHDLPDIIGMFVYLPKV